MLLVGQEILSTSFKDEESEALRIPVALVLCLLGLLCLSYLHRGLLQILIWDVVFTMSVLLFRECDTPHAACFGHH